MNIDFWIDPLCPWCWITSRWLRNEVAPERNLQINWRSISLNMKNNPSEDNQFYESSNHTKRLLRVFEAIKSSQPEKADEFYTQAGSLIHNGGNPLASAAQILEAAKIDAEFAKSYDDDSLDQVVRAEMDEGLKLVGQDVGTPIIAFDSANGRKAIFGPVLSRVPNKEDSLEVWDSIVKISSMDHFWELKRTRTEGPNFDGTV